MQRHTTQNIMEGYEEQKTPIAGSAKPGVASSLLPTDEMRRAKRWLEVIQNPPQPDQDLLAIHGWLSPKGVLYACAWEKHNELTAALGFRHESEIEQSGFCKLSQLKWLVEPRYCEHGVTAAQWETIERWYEKNGFPDEHFMRLGALT